MATAKTHDNTTTVRIRERALTMLRELAAEESMSMTDLLDRAIDAYRRTRFLEAVNRDFAALRADENAWQEYQDELRLWDATLMDGLEDD